MTSLNQKTSMRWPQTAGLAAQSYTMGHNPSVNRTHNAVSRLLFNYVKRSNCEESMKTQFRIRIRLAVLALCTAALIVSSCSMKGTYRPVYYPDSGNLTNTTRGPTFDNLAQARQWAEDQRRQRRDPNWTYEIGKNCKPFQDTDMEVCEETLR